MRVHSQNRSVAGSLTIYPSNRLRSVKNEPLGGLIGIGAT
jgi:hypothetical protein